MAQIARRQRLEEGAYFVDTYADLCEPEIGQDIVGILESNDCVVEHV